MHHHLTNRFKNPRFPCQSRLDMYIAHNPAGTSVQNGLHWRQIRNSKLFQAYDYGSTEKNKKKYNQTTPLIYKLEDIKIPLAMWTGNLKWRLQSEIYICTASVPFIIGEFQHKKSFKGKERNSNLALEFLQPSMKKRNQENGSRIIKNSTKSRKGLTEGRYRLIIWTVIITACLWQGIINLGFWTSEQLATEHTMDPECFFNVSEIIQYHGYPSEEYHIETEDGYILTVFRIPHGYNGADKSSRPAVFLLHSFVGGAFLWISNQPSNSLGFILADAGYDVWIGNSRGNTYSSNHKILDLSENKFWEFSFHEMGYYDVPAVIDFILNKTGQKQLFYIGHSEGSTAGFIAFSTWPKLAEKIKVFFALAPITTITFATTPIIKLGAAYEKLFHLGFLNKGTFHLPTYTRKLSAMFCAYLPKFCVHIFCSISGFNIPNLNMSRIDVYAAQWSSGTSGRNFIHWIQMNRAKLFQAYDYGSTEKNMEKYNQTVPPTYKIEDIKIPIAIWTGGQDFFADPRDVAMLVPRISNLIYEKYIPEWQHLDFIWGLDAPEHMYMDIIKIMKKYL